MTFAVSMTRISATQASSSVGRNTFWNLLGTGLPLLLALITIPVLIQSIGIERFGTLTIAWMVLGYFGLLDLGLGRATIKFLAEAFEQNRVAEIRALFWTSLLSSALLGLVGFLILAALSPLLVVRILNVPAELQSETLHAFYLLACSVPLVTIMSTLRSTFEAQHRFGLLNALQIPTSVLTQIAPLLALPFSYSLTWLVGALVLSRLLETVVFFVAALWKLESPFEGPFFLRKRLGRLLSYGGWLTVTNVIGPFMIYADRFFIGSLSSMTAVAYYTTPFEATTRMWVLPRSLTRTIFPIFSAGTEVAHRTRIYLNATKYLSILFVPVVSTVIIFAPELLRVWVGEAFVENSTTVMQILAVGVFVNSLALISYALIQGLGRPDVTAKFHLLELPVYLLLLWYGVQYWGITGAATVWTARVCLDALLLVVYLKLTANVTSSPAVDQLLRALMLVTFLIFSSWLLYVITSSLLVKLLVWGLLLSVTMYVAWRYLLEVDEWKKLAG